MVPKTGWGRPILSKSTLNLPSVVDVHRRGLRSHGLQSIEVRVRGEDAPLVRTVAATLADLDQAGEARSLLRLRYGPEATRSLKDLLATAPLDDIDLTRSRDTGRASPSDG